MPNSGLPARIDREALERIIRRAAELQTGYRDIGDVLTPEEVIKLGREVGIPEGYLQQAMLEESTRADVSEGHGFLDQAFGPAQVRAQRVVQGDSESVEQALLQWMEEDELMAVIRQSAGRIAWEPLRSFQATVRAALGGRRPYLLLKAETIEATLVPLETGYCNVVLTAVPAEGARRFHWGRHGARRHRPRRIGGAGGHDPLLAVRPGPPAPRTCRRLGHHPTVPPGGRTGPDGTGTGAGPAGTWGRETGTPSCPPGPASSACWRERFAKR